MLAAPRAPMPPLPEFVPVTYSARFDAAYTRNATEAEVVVEGLGKLRESWSGYSLERVGEVVPFVIDGVQSGHTNLFSSGAVRLWVKPDWSSAVTGAGAGPGHLARLLEMSVVVPGQSAPVWSLQVSADGAAISLVGAGEKESGVLLTAAITWRAGEWHQVILNYSESDTALSLDGKIVAEGAAVLAVPPNVAALTVGSSLVGTESFEGEIEEMFCFARPLKTAFHYLPFKDLAARGPIGVDEMAYRAELAEQWKAAKAESGGGGMMLRMAGPAVDCVTNLPLYLTNTACVYDPSRGWMVTFDVQGTNGPADIFTTTNLTGNSLTNSQWVWLERGPSCSTYQYTNQPTSQSYYILGTTNDADADLLTDAYEKLVSKTNPDNGDTDGDGMPDGWEVQHGLNPLVNDASDDPDGDWLTNVQEYNGGTNSTDPHDVMVVAWGDNSAGQCSVPLNLRGVKAVAAGDDFSLALKSDGTVVAWGANTYGQTNVPTDLTNAVAISANFSHTIALRSNNTISLWGRWWYSSNYFSLDQPSNPTNIALIATGANHDLAVRSDGTVTAWSPFFSTPYTTVPTNVISPKAMAAGYSHSVAVLSNGTVAAWGENLGSTNFLWNVVTVPAGLSNVTSVAAGQYHTLALKADGNVVAWGAGNGSNPPVAIHNNGQSIVPAGLSNVIAVAAARDHSLALRKDGSVVVWGDMASPNFLQSNAIAIATGEKHALALRTGRQLPVLVQAPKSLADLPGTNVTFTAFGLGLAEVKYQWQFNGVNLTGQTNATLTVTNLQPASEGNYTVVLATGAGSITSSVATLQMVAAPVVTNTIPTAPGTYEITYGSFVTLTVQATALELDRYKLRYQWYTNGVAITGATNQSYHFTPSWFPLWQTNPASADYTVKVWNVVGTNEAGPWTIQVISPFVKGSTVAWGNNSDGQVEYPTNLTDAVSIAAGEDFSVAAKENGSVVQWGYEWATVPANLTNAVSVAAGLGHALAVRDNGTVTLWGDTNNIYVFRMPTNLSGVKAVSAGRYHDVALLTNSTVTVWGANLWELTNVPPALSNVTAISAGSYHSLALKADGTVVSWGYNADGQTNVPSGLSNAVAVAAGGRHSLALKADGTITAWGYNGYGQAAPPAGLSNVMAVAAGWAHSAALKNDGTMVCWGDNSSGQTNTPTQLNNTKLIAAGGDHTLATVFSPLMDYNVDVTKDLLLIYNTTSTNSIVVKDYYLAHRPMVGGANTLGISCATNEVTSYSDFTNQILAPYLNWLNQNPTKRPQYIILFPDMPSRVWTNDFSISISSVAMGIHQGTPATPPFITSINMGLYNLTNDCIAYINKLESFGSNFSSGKLFISASAGGYGNNNYIVDNVRHDGYGGSLEVRNATNGLSGAGVSATNIFYRGDVEVCLGTNTIGFCTNYNAKPHITNAVDVAAYICWGGHSTLGNQFVVNGLVQWQGESKWWIIETIESYNGLRDNSNSYQSNFLEWFSANAFGGTNYANTPVGAVSHVEEPGLSGVNQANLYFGLWASGKHFGIAAWASWMTNMPYPQVIGDPFVIR